MILQTALLCLAANIYFEARGENVRGQEAVALVTMNRADWNPKRVCKVVHQHGQFSWTAGSKGIRDEAGWVSAKIVAQEVLNGNVYDFTDGATYFHVKSLRPTWHREKHYLMTVGKHRFYRDA